MGSRASLVFVLSFSIVLQITVCNAAFMQHRSPQNVNFITPTECFPQISVGKNNHQLFARDSMNDDSSNDNENQEQKNAKNRKNGDNPPSWMLPSDNPESAERRARMARLHEEMQRFVHGSELQNLRTDVVALKESLQIALATDDIGRIVTLYKAIE